MSRVGADSEKIDLYGEASRQFVICNACRYCEGYCAVFPAIERRLSYDGGYVDYVANLCHDCRDCYYACPYISPHEISINIPLLLSSVRLESYVRYTYPERVARIFFRRPLEAGLVTTIASMVAMWLLALLIGNPSRIFQRHVYSGSFYNIIPYWLIVVGGLALLAYIAVVFIISSHRYWGAINRGSKRSIALGALIRALRDAVSHRYFRGGGAGCDYPGMFSGYRRLYTHLSIFLGLFLATLATIAAAIHQEILAIMPPYSYQSPPVILGISGGILMIFGSSTLIYYKARGGRTLAERSMAVLDAFMLSLLALISLTGSALLALRGSEYMGPLFITHMGFVLALFIMAPYSKLIHIPYRLLSLTKSRVDAETET